MTRNEIALRDALVGGGAASVLSTLALMAAGKHENGSMVAPINAVSHWLWGDRALEQDQASLKYTVPGYAIHHGSAMMWAAMYSLLHGQRPGARMPARAAGAAAVTAAAACFVDFRMTPKRLTPGFEHRLTPQSIALVYALFAAGLALASIAMSGEGVPTRSTRRY
jgi:hypothetical protein